MLKEPFISIVEYEFIYKDEFRIGLHLIISCPLSEKMCFWNFYFIFLDLVRHSGRWGKNVALNSLIYAVVLKKERKSYH